MRDWFNRTGWRDLIIATPYAWLIVFFLIPFLIVVVMSLAIMKSASPPFGFHEAFPWIDLGNFARLFQDTLYIRAFVSSLLNALIATLLCLLIGYPMALGITRVSKSWRNILLMLVILPFWTSFLLRVYAWIGMMGSNSWFNKLLTSIYNFAVPGEWALKSIPMMNTSFAVVLVMVYSYLPFMILPLYANLARMDLTLLEAAADLGCRATRAFLRITLPLSLPGIVAGSMLVFIPVVGEFVIPDLLGGPDNLMVGRMLWTEFFGNKDWPLASAIAILLLVVLVVPFVLMERWQQRLERE